METATANVNVLFLRTKHGGAVFRLEVIQLCDS